MDIHPVFFSFRLALVLLLTLRSAPMLVEVACIPCSQVEVVTAEAGVVVTMAVLVAARGRGRRR